MSIGRAVDTWGTEISSHWNLERLTLLFALPMYIQNLTIDHPYSKLKISIFSGILDCKKHYFSSSSLSSFRIFASIFEVSYSLSMSNSSHGWLHFCAAFILCSGSSNFIPFILYLGLSHRFDHGLGFIRTCS